MVDLEKELLDYYDEKVKLSDDMYDEMKSRRDSNRQRLESGLKNNGYPNSVRYLEQGSYVMKTMIQRPNNNFDIDDGVIFSKESLIGPRGGEITALDARRMVQNALEDERFNDGPESLSSCVRVFYNEGYHIDVPVYRESKEYGRDVLELAASEWKESNPVLLSDWFESQVSLYGEKLRMVVCLLKKWAISRTGWNLPNGLIFSVYASTNFPNVQVRLDEALVRVLESTHRRLKSGYTKVQNPVDPDDDFAEHREKKIENLKDALAEHLPKLTDVIHDRNCTKNEALRAWAAFFNDDFFKKYLEDDANTLLESALLAEGIPTVPVKKDGSNRYA